MPLSILRRTTVLVGVLGVSLSACATPVPSTPPITAPPAVTPTAVATPGGGGTTSSGGVTPTGSPVSSPTVSDAPTARPSFSPRDVATGLQAPWSVVFHDGVALVSERDSGRILELSTDGKARQVAVIEGVPDRGEGGLLGLAVDDQERLYAYYTRGGVNRIVRFDVSGGAGSLALGEPVVVLDGLNENTTHNGGRIAFGPDGMLYASTGDAGVPRRAQDLSSLSGKILRMTPDGDVPPGNPFGDSLVWTLGHRNVQGLAWGLDGTMYATEFGQDTWDELNIIEPGKNYGWPVVEGIANDGDYTDPVQQWSPGDASPSGMAHLDGTLYIANLRGRRLRAIDVSDLSQATEFFVEEYGRLRDVAVAPDGALWVITNNTDGRGDPHDGDDRILEVGPGALIG